MSCEEHTHIKDCIAAEPRWSLPSPNLLLAQDSPLQPLKKR